ncbi:uncharacterized protein ABDE67_017978 [Symphorus nematophorus]
MAAVGQPDQSGITRLLSTINSLVCLPACLPARDKGRGGGRGGGAGWRSFNAQTVQSNQPMMLFVLSAEESTERIARQRREAFSAAAHSELLAAEREFRRLDLFTWSRSVLLIGGEELEPLLARTCFKWFGSLTNLSFRRSTEKSDSKSSPSKSGERDGTDCGPGTTGTLAPVAETTVDDMGAMRPRTASYVRSSENYTHMGTLPRLLMKRKDKRGPSSSKKSKGKSSISRSQSQRPAGHQDHGPPKVKAASSIVCGDVDEVKADSELGQDSLPDLKTQPESACEINAANTQNTISGPTAACEDLSPSGGSSAVLQPDTCDNQSVTRAGADLNQEETSPPPLSQKVNQTHEDDGIESAPVSEPKEKAESRDLTEEADKGKQNSDSIYR